MPYCRASPARVRTGSRHSLHLEVAQATERRCPRGPAGAAEGAGGTGGSRQDQTRSPSPSGATRGKEGHSMHVGAGAKTVHFLLSEVNSGFNEALNGQDGLRFESSLAETG